MTLNVQTAPMPDVLFDLVAGLTYKPGWTLELQPIERGQDCAGLTFIVTTYTTDSYHADQFKRVCHYFPVPAAAYDLRSWRHWLLGRLIEVETHETCEFFTIDGEKPYAPSHGPGNDPYLIRELGTELDVRTAFTGRLNGSPADVEPLDNGQEW